MMKKKQNSSVSEIISKLIILLISVLLFVFANPNILIKNGIGILGFFIYWPVLILINKCSIKNVWLYGGLYGALSYGFYGYWLNSFHPLGLIITLFCYFLLLALVFIGLKIIEKLFLENGWLVQWLFLCSYEYIKTLGFAGFSYGVTSYTQWKNIYFIQACDLLGVFGLNLFVIFPSCWIFNFFGREISSKRLKNISLIAYACCFSALYIYGFADIKLQNNKIAGEVKVAAVQNNEDPWKNGIEEYARNIHKLKTLTDEVMELNDKVDIVVWPETAVVPSIFYQYFQGNDPKRKKVINSLLNYIDSKECTFVIGNTHEIVDISGVKQRYNCSAVFEPGVNVYPPNPDMYAKIHLVPFTETFPYKHSFPSLYVKLLNGDTHMWDKGSEYSVFEAKGLKFSTPICFEDTFGDDCRQFVKNGARCFLNLSNDAWSKSLVCQNQHLAMAVFRSIENRVPGVRSTASGQTCIISQHGKIEKMASPFCETYVIGNVPVLKEDFKVSVYTRYGDYAGKIEIILTVVLLIIQIFNVIIKITKSKHNNNR